MSGSRKVLLRLLVVALMTTSLAGCGSMLSKSSKGDISTIQASIVQVVPDCKLEELTVPDGLLSNKNAESDRVRNFTNRLVEFDYVYAKLANGETDMNEPEVGIKYVNPSQDKFFVCNPNGTALSEVNRYQDVWGEDLPDGFFCWSPNERYAKDNLRRLKI
jgi:hypothetical protein